MSRFLHRTAYLSLSGMTILLFSLLIQGCQKNVDASSGKATGVVGAQAFKDPKILKDFTQVNLVANNNNYGAAHIDPHLLNAWGIAFSGNGIAWVGSQEGHVSTVYDREGNMLAARPEVAIPSPTGPSGGNPTGVVTNIDPNTTDFHLSNGQTARFMFAGVDGVISGWNPAAGNNALVIKNNAPAASYTGITMGQSNGQYFLYAANFVAGGGISIWDKNFNPVSMGFTDPMLPSDYVPFNIQNLNGKLYVMYAKIGEGGDEVAKPGNGYVDIYQTDGTLEKRLVSQGQLNAPWGVAHAPASFFTDENGQGQESILVGNLGDGRINAFSMEGRYLGQLRSHGNPIVIPHLWAIMFPPSTSTIDPGRLYFAAGPEDETDGLFGYITK
ncbi:MAG: TIGR03118 family protein [Flavisolibacter sp.]